MAQIIVGDAEREIEQVAELLAQLTVKDWTDAEILTWSQTVTNIVTAQQHFNQVGKEIRDMESIIEKLINRVARLSVVVEQMNQ